MTKARCQTWQLKSHIQRQRWFVSFVEWFLRISFCYLVYLVLGTC